MNYKFPQINNEAEYDYFSYIISFSNINYKIYNQIVKSPINIDNVNHFNIIAHECTHYLDHISTLRGQELMLSSLEAVNLIKYPQEKEMWKIINFNKLHKTVFHDSYYKIIDKSVKDTDMSKWSFMPTVGLRFDRKGRIDNSNPILFTRFHYNKERVARIPISLESIWEANAMFTEIENTSRELIKLKDNNFDFNMYGQDFENGMKKYIYNSDLLVYSHIAHYISKEIIDDGDLLLAYTCVRVISGICSSLPNDFFRTLKIPNNLFYSFSKDRVSKLKANRDIGLLFLSLIFNYIIKYPNPIERRLHAFSDRFGEFLLSASDLPPKEIIEKAVINKMDINIKRIESIGYKSQFHVEQIHLGKEYFLKRGLFNMNLEEIITQENMNKFPIILEDDMSSSHCERYYEYEEYQKKIREFSTACMY